MRDIIFLRGGRVVGKKNPQGECEQLTAWLRRAEMCSLGSGARGLVATGLEGAARWLSELLRLRPRLGAQDGDFARFLLSFFLDVLSLWLSLLHTRCFHLKRQLVAVHKHGGRCIYGRCCCSPSCDWSLV